MYYLAKEGVPAETALPGSPLSPGRPFLLCGSYTSLRAQLESHFFKVVHPEWKFQLLLFSHLFFSYLSQFVSLCIHFLSLTLNY